MAHDPRRNVHRESADIIAACTYIPNVETLRIR
jgi:hypothetical protein